MAADSASDLESEALKRRQKLQALRNKKVNKNSDSQDGENSTKESAEGSLPKPIFRNYNPHDETLREHTLPRAKLMNLEEAVKDELEAAKTKPVVEGLDLSNLAPRKPDWDLKRDVSKKLEVLERQTQRAIAELIRARLKPEDDLAAMVNIGAKSNEFDNDNDNNSS